MARNRDLGKLPYELKGGAGKTILSKVTSDDYDFEFRSLQAGDMPTGIDAANIGTGVVSNTEFGYLDGVTSNIQTQINGKQGTDNYITALTGDVTATGPNSASASIANNAVTFSKFQQISSAKILGNSTGGTSNIQEITIGSGLSLSAGTLSNTATPTPTGYYGAFFDLTTQNAASTNTPYAIKLSNTNLSNGISIVSNSRITIANTGIYNIQFSAQFYRTNSGTDIIDIWLRKNGVDVADTNTQFVMSGSSTASQVVASWNFVIDAVAGDYYELMWATPDTHVQLYYAPAQTSPFVHPAIPSVILTVTQQSGIMAGTGITAINSLTGSAQTIVTGTSGSDFGITSSGTTHTFNLPTASAANRGLLSTTDWSTFNGKQAALSGSGIVKSTGGTISYLTDNSTNWDSAYTNRITSLTTTGSSGSATLVSNVLNIPTYTLAGLGGQPLATNLTSLSGLTYASASFVKMTAAGTFSLDTATYLTGNQTITLGGDLSGSGTTSITASIGANKVTVSMLAQAAANSILGNNTGSPANVAYLTGIEVTAMLDTFTSTLKGLTPASGGGTTKFLRADGNWAAPYTFSTGLTESAGTVTANLSVGVSGGQSVIGGSASGNSLTLTSTSNATKGNIIFGSAGLSVYDEVNNRFGINITAPSAALHIVTNISAESFWSDRYVGTTAAGAPGIILRKARGTSSSPTAAQSGDTLGVFGFRGYGSTAFSSGSRAALLAYAAETWTDTAQGTYLAYSTTINGSTTLSEKLRIDNDGNVLIGTTTNGGFKLDVNGTFRSQGDVTIADAKNIILNTTTGTKIGTATTQKIGFWNAAPIIQPTTAISTSITFTANTGTAINSASTFGGYTIIQVIQALKNLGIIA